MKSVRTAALVACSIFAIIPVHSQVLPASGTCNIPAAKVSLAPGKKTDTSQGLIVTGFFSEKGLKGCIAATDLTGTQVWSYCGGTNLLMTRPIPGGTFLVLTNKTTTDYAVSEIDLNGNTVHSLTEASANSQLKAMGKQAIIDFNHEAMRLPNGYTAVIAHNERLETDVQGPGTVDVMGDEVLVLDTNWKIVWVWNAFDFLPVSRVAILHEGCKPCSSLASGCCPITLADHANDWLHGNSLAYDAVDGNLVLSLRSQDWVVKIAYQNGAGDGHLVWTLGNQGSFTMLNTPQITWPWFSHQHDVEIIGDGSPHRIMLFDNGNTRHATDATATSRGQILTVNEQTMTVDIATNVDFPFYSDAYGTSQLMGNGNYWWQAGLVGGHSDPDPTRSAEYAPGAGINATASFGIQFGDTSYRSFRMTSLTGF